MDGRTTVISRAATMAARKGVVVVNSAGNSGNNTSHNTLNAPADADSILTVGAVNAAGVRASFSSVGPTTDPPGRIKPDVMAEGAGVTYASSSNPTQFLSQDQGTSFSCPLVAGVVALLLKNHPHATPMQIITALKSTASNTDSPNNLMGWGIVNAQAASNLLGVTPVPLVPPSFSLSQNYPNPFNPSTTLIYSVTERASMVIRVFDVFGREVRTLTAGERTPGVYPVVWDGTNASGTLVASGTYFCRCEATPASGKSVVITRKMMIVR
jgi:subtilisin family serine protease